MHVAFATGAFHWQLRQTPVRNKDIPSAISTNTHQEPVCSTGPRGKNTRIFDRQSDEHPPKARIFSVDPEDPAYHAFPSARRGSARPVQIAENGSPGQRGAAAGAGAGDAPAALLAGGVVPRGRRTEVGGGVARPFEQRQLFDLLVSAFWSIVGHGPKGLTFCFWVLGATEPLAQEPG